MPHTIAWSRAAAGRSPRRARPRRRSSRSRGSSCSPTSGAVWPRPLGYCSLTSAGSPRMRAACDELRAGAGDPLEGVIGAKALLDVDDHQRRALAREQAHQAPTIASARSRWAMRAGGERQQHAALQAPPGEAAVLRAALPAVLAGDPLGVEVDERRGWRGCADGDRRRRQPEQRGAGGHALDQQRQLEHAGQHQARCRARRRPSPGRSCPSAPARRAPPSPRARAARGRWRRSRSCPSRSPSTSARRSRLGGQRRVHLHARVQAAHVLLGEQQVVRADLGADPPAARLGAGDAPRPRPRS